MYLHDVTYVLENFRQMIPYTGPLSVYDAERVISDPNFPTPTDNKIIQLLVSNLQYEKSVAFGIDNSNFKNSLTANFINLTNAFSDRIPDKNLILILLSREFGLPNENMKDMKQAIIEARLNVITNYNSKGRRERWKYGLLYAFLTNIDFVYYNVIREEDAVAFGEAYYLYSYIDTVDKSEYKQLSPVAQYITLKLLGYGTIVDLDILTEESIHNFLEFKSIEFSEDAINKRSLYSKHPSFLVEAIAKTNDDYLDCYMPRFLFIKPIPLIAPYLMEILTYTDYTITNLGIVIPVFIKNKVKYVVDNARDYNTMIKNRQNVNDITAFTDMELLTKYGFVEYVSRESLIRELTRLQQENGFFIPLVNKFCKNEITAYHVPVKDLLTVAYGTLNDYYCYSADELLQMITYSEETKTTTLNLWHSNIQITDIEQLTKFKNLLSYYSVFNSVVQKLQSYLEKSINVDQRIKQQFNELTDEEKSTIKSLLYQTFIVGMYMRRWSGNGPYPMKLSQTEININPEPLTIKGLIDFFQIFENSSLRVKEFFSSLPAYRDMVNKTKQTLLNIIKNVSLGEQVEEGESCIRLNNSRLVFSSYRYLMDLYVETIPGFNIDEFKIIY